MTNDMDLIRQLENKIGSPLKQGQFDDLLESKQNGYAVDEQGAITGLCLFKVSLDLLSETILPFKGLRQLVLSDVDIKDCNFSPLRQLTSLTLLDLSQNRIKKIAFLSQLTNITQLYLGSNRIADLSPLEGLVQLATLDLQKNRLNRIDSLGKIPSLKIVNLQGNNIPDISPLRGLSRIVYLNINGNKVSDISSLQGLSHLANLDAAHNQIENISILSHLPGLSYLNLSNNKITDISPIRGLASLTVLKLKNTNISSIFSLAGLRNLNDLDLGENKISDLTALEGLTDLEKLNLAFNQLTDLAPLATLMNLTLINLSNNQLTDLTALAALTNLTTLGLGGNQLTDLTPLASLSNLKELWLIGNQITDLTSLATLTNLTGLDLRENQITDLTSLATLTNLTDLDLRENQITDLTSLATLTNLTNLYLNYNQLTDLASLIALSNLKELYLYNNQLTDLTPLAALTNLTRLDLSNNQLTNLTPLAALANLTNLYLNNNQLTDLAPLATLTNLTTLGLNNNQITDLAPLATLTNLTALGLNNNQITDLALLASLTKLTKLDLGNNQIRQLPPEITSWWPAMKINWNHYIASGLNLYGNPLTDPPIEIVKQGNDAIKAYFDSLKGETLPLNEVKVLMVGDGGAGKTSLVNRLMGKPFDNKEPQTPGINIDLWEVKHQKNSIKIHLWDFGGQEIMHATHQFFLSKRSLYILVLDGRKDEKIEYWLKHIRSFGGDSPVLVVLNKIDQNPGFELNRRFLQEKYPNIKDFFRLSCAYNNGIDDFKKALEKAAANVEIIRTNWATSWFQVKQTLENMTEPYISLEQYNALCLKENITDPAGRDTLVEFLHDLGVILHFDDLGLGDVHVLEPRWATEAVYKIINSPITAANKGIIKPSLLTGILNQKQGGDYDYPPDKHHYIVELMKKFEICYQLNTGDILIPDLLAVEESRFQFDYDGSLRFIFHYDFLPPSVMPRFIVRMHNDIKDDCRWRTGVLLENKAFNAAAVVKTDNEEKKIYIYVKGQQKRDYFSVIRFIIRDINAGFENINAVEWVPLPEAKEITLEYSELIGLEKMGIDVMPIGKLGKKIPVSLLLNGYEKEEDRLMRIQEEDRLMQDSRAGSGKAINFNGTVGMLTIVQHEGDYSPVSVANDNPLEEKIGEIIKLLIEHNVAGKDQFIRHLQDERVKRDKGKLREVIGKMLSVTGDIGSVYSAVAGLLPHL